MGGLDLVAGGQIGDGAGHAENAVVAPGGEAHGLEGGLEQRGALVGQAAILPQLGRTHGRVGGDAGGPIPLALAGPGGDDPLPDGRGGLGRTLPPELGEVQRRDLHDHIDPVQQRAADPAQILPHRPGRAGAPARGVAVPAAFTGIHGADQHKLAGIRLGARHPGDGDPSVLQGLAQDLQGVLPELRQLVQEQHAPVGQRHLPGPGHRTAAGQPRRRDGMMGTAEGADVDQGMVRRQKAHDRVDLCDLQRLLRAQPG